MRSGPSNSMLRCGRSLSRRSTIWPRRLGTGDPEHKGSTRSVRDHRARTPRPVPL